MAKIRLTESDLKHFIKEAINKAIEEPDTKDISQSYYEWELEPSDEKIMNTIINHFKSYGTLTFANGVKKEHCLRVLNKLKDCMDKNGWNEEDV